MSHAEEDRQKGNCRLVSQISELLLYTVQARAVLVAMFLGLGWVLLTTDGWQVVGTQNDLFSILSLHLSVFQGII